MAGDSTETPVAAASGARESTSQLIARILDQLSVSAWLPSAALVFSVLMLVNLRAAKGSAADAFHNLSELSGSSLVLLVGATIVLTMLTQAFEFEAIRALEGYWGSSWPASAIGERLCRRKIKRRDALERRAKALTRSALATARVKMLEEGLERDHVDALEDRILARSAEHSAEVRRAAASLPWREFAEAHLIRRLDAVEAAFGAYPSRDHRVLPTRLGNVLRAHEDRAFPASGASLEGRVLLDFHKLPRLLQTAHDEDRSRLDLYCDLVVVSTIVGGIGVAVLAPLGATSQIIVAAAALVGVWLSYRAAVATADAYGVVLESIAAFEIEDSEQ